MSCQRAQGEVIDASRKFWAQNSAVPSVRDSFRRWRSILLILAVLATAGVGAGWLTPLGGYFPLRVTTAVLTLVLAVSLWRPILKHVVSNLYLLPFLTWSAIAAFWAESPFDALTTLIGLASVVFLASVVVTLWPGDVASRVFMWIFTATSIVSLLAIVIVPEISTVTVTHPSEGLLVQPIGVFIWNSDFGLTAGIGATLAACFWLKDHRDWLMIAVFAVNIGAVVLSNAAASLIVALAGLATLLLLVFPRTVLAGLAGVVLVGAIVGFPKLIELALGVLGRSADLTGRSTLWSMTLDQAAQKPILGHGTGTEPDFTGVSSANHAHNGFLQIYFDRGIIGLLLIGVLVISALVWAILRGAKIQAVVIVMVVVANTANNYLSYASLGLLLLVWTSYAVTPAPRFVTSSFARLGGVSDSQHPIRRVDTDFNGSEGPGSTPTAS